MVIKPNSNGDFVPFGFDKKAFLEKARYRKSQLSQLKKEDDYNIIPELQYESLLKRAYSQFKPVQNKGLLKLPLTVKRESHHKTSMNLHDIGQGLGRNPEHVKNFLLTELGTTGNVNGEGKLTLKGVFLKSDIQNVLLSYAENFVVCKTCGNTNDTNIIKEKQIYYLNCQVCGAKKHVANYGNKILDK